MLLGQQFVRKQSSTKKQTRASKEVVKMPLSRQFSPKFERDGIWFKHIGGNADQADYSVTTYNRLHSAPWNPDTKAKLSQPAVFNERFGDPRPIRHNPGFKSRNPFTAQENKHLLANFCEGGLGSCAKSEQGTKSQITDPNLLTYVGHGETLEKLGESRFTSTANSTFLPFILRQPTGDRSENQGSEEARVFDDQPRFRRYRREYTSPSPGLRRPSTKTTDQLVPPDVPHKTPLDVIRATQEPWYTANPWKYSYVGPTESFAYTKGARARAQASSTGS